MSYKTILVHVGHDADSAGRIRLAVRLARAHGAHLVGAAATGIPRFLAPAAIDAAGAPFASRCRHLRAQARLALDAFDAIVREQDMLSAETSFADDEADAALALRARYCDLVVAGQDHPQLVDPCQPTDLAARLALSCVCPILVVPPGSWPQLPGGGVAVAWDGSLEATRAVTAALPLLGSASHVTVLGIAPPSRRPGAEIPGVELAQWLRRHRIAARATRVQAHGDAGATLLAAAAGLRASLLVMGAFGRSRLRETVLGGATATVLGRMTLPVLLAH